MRIVLEHENPLVGAGLAQGLTEAGHSVAVCRGPTERGGRQCPVTADLPCPLVDEADVVLAALPSDQLKVYVAVRQRYDVPVVLSLGPAERARLPQLERIGPWVPRNLGATRLAEALELAVRAASSAPGGG